jgi:hypothetical protein
MTQSHTPTPKLRGPCQPESNFQKGKTLKLDDTGKVIATLTREGEKHAAFIVRACNAFPHFEAQRNKCCTYCADERPAFEKDGGWWHEVARGGDGGDTEPCKAHWYHAALAKAKAGAA